uniref:C-type lectin domain-containing protein n=1 Tax=Leptobrachium leishanense TaxID=445787 RepID=A0A8C5QMN6_9ANUR
MGLFFQEMSNDYPDHQFLQLGDNSENKVFKMNFWSPPPYSRVVTALCAVCAICFITVIILIVALKPAEPQPDQRLHHQMTNLSDGIYSHMERSSLDDSKVIDKLKNIEASVQRILIDKTTDVLQKDIASVLVVLRKLSDWATKQNSSFLDSLCGADWAHHSFSCYYLSSDTLSWQDAKKACESMNSHLLVINNNEEQRFISTFSRPFTSWIGLTDADGSWEWVDGTPYDSTPKSWQDGQPDDYYYHQLGGGEDCAQMKFITTAGWNDEHCTRKQYYICEKKVR